MQSKLLWLYGNTVNGNLVFSMSLILRNGVNCVFQDIFIAYSDLWTFKI
jgi:hypothetical protein